MAGDPPMTHASPLPDYLAKRYAIWKTRTFLPNATLHQTLVDGGQHPRDMLISCCDSRVNITSIFGAEAGDAFVHRNIANFVPPYDPDDPRCGTAAAIEYGVTALKVQHLAVVGHSSCGGVAGCHAACESEEPVAESFVGTWVKHMRPAYERLRERAWPVDLRAMEQEAVLLSIENMMTYPFVAAAVADGALTLHGLWTDIGTGELLHYSPDTRSFVPV